MEKKGSLIQSKELVFFEVVKRTVWERKKRRKPPASSLHQSMWGTFTSSPSYTNSCFRGDPAATRAPFYLTVGPCPACPQLPRGRRSQLGPGAAESTTLISKSKKVSAAFGGLWIGSCAPGMAESRKALKTQHVSSFKLLWPSREASWSLNFCKNMHLCY